MNQADELNRLMTVRRSALNRMGEQTIRKGAPTVTLEEPFVPIWMYHRYAVEAAASMVAGQDFVYAMRGDGRAPMNGNRPSINAKHSMRWPPRSSRRS